MPELTVVVSGTGTEVGKTWFAARVAESLARRGVPVTARKPVQSFEPGSGRADAAVLAAATGDLEAEVCPPHRSYPVAMAPPIAARVLGRPPVTLAQLVAEIDLPRDGVVLVEGVGGPRSPLASDGDTVALAAALDADLVAVVGDAGLGAINAMLLSTEAFAPRPVVAALNRFEPGDDLHERNRAWLEDEAGLRVVTQPRELAGIILRSTSGLPAEVS